MIKILLRIFLILLIIGTTAFLSFYVGLYSSYQSVLKDVDEIHQLYYDKTEELLDSINRWNPLFMDSIIETKVYVEYEEARDFMHSK